MPHGRIDELADSLSAAGIDPAGLRELQLELDLIEAPPGLFARLSRSVASSAGRQWRHALAELRESREALGLIRRRLSDGAPLSEEEADQVRGQLLDVLRVVPAGVIAVANSAFPVPGTGLLTPWLLARLGLMPSRWREAHLLFELRKQAGRLREEGHLAAAERVEALEAELEDEADARESADREAALLTHWDANQNGRWDAEEQAAYAAALARLRAQYAKSRAQRRWFLQHDGHIFGPVRLSEVERAAAEMHLLVCYDGRSGWFELGHLLAPAS